MKKVPMVSRLILEYYIVENPDIQIQWNHINSNTNIKV